MGHIAGAHGWYWWNVVERCGKCPKVPSQVLGAPANMGLLILSCFKEFEFGKWKYHALKAEAAMAEVKTDHYSKPKTL